MTGSYITLKSLSEADDEEDIVAYYFPDSYKNVSGKYVWIELTYNNTYDVVANDTVLKNCKSLTSAKRWVSTNL